MLPSNYKLTCSYSFTAMLPSAMSAGPRQTLPDRWLFAHHQLALAHPRPNTPLPFSRHSQMRPRILPRHGLALLDSSIQSP